MSKDAWHRFGDKGYKHYQVVESGFKYNMMDVQAAIGIHQLARVDHNLLRRERFWEMYQERLCDLPLTLPTDPEPGTRHGRHLYTILVEEELCDISRDAFLEHMNARSIGTGVHYLAIPEQPYYGERFGWRPEDWPEATRIGRSTVSLPLSPSLSNDELDRIESAIREIIS